MKANRLWEYCSKKLLPPLLGVIKLTPYVSLPHFLSIVNYFVQFIIVRFFIAFLGNFYPIAFCRDCGIFMGRVGGYKILNV
jgi:hypothetical protein